MNIKEIKKALIANLEIIKTTKMVFSITQNNIEKLQQTKNNGFKKSDIVNLALTEFFNKYKED